MNTINNAGDFVLPEVKYDQSLSATPACRGEETLVANTFKTGVVPVIVDTGSISLRVNKNGADLPLLISEAVHTGGKLFGEYQAVRGEALLSLDMAYWQGKLSKVQVKQAFGKMPMAPRLVLGKCSPEAFVQALVKKLPSLKLFAADNLIDYLPSCASEVSADNVAKDVMALHDAFVENGSGFLALLDKANQSQEKLIEACKGLRKVITVINVKHLDNRTLSFRVQGPFDPVMLKLEMVNGKWAIKPETKKARAPRSSKKHPETAVVETDVAEADQAEDKAVAAA